MPVELAVAVQVFIFLQLLLELGLDDVDGGVHIEGAFFDYNYLFRQMESYFASETVILLPGFDFFKMYVGVGALAGMLGDITVQVADFTGNISLQLVIQGGVYGMNFEFL